MALVYLISDFQESSYKIGLLKSEWLLALKRPDIVDITHNISLNNMIEAAFIADQIQFPEYQNIITVFKIGENHESIVYQHFDRLYILPNNGLIGLLFDKIDTNSVYLIDSSLETQAALAFLENRLDKLPKAGQKLALRYPKQLNFTSNLLIGEVVFSDKHGNCYFNLKKNQFEEFVRNRQFQIKIQHFASPLADKISQSVYDVEQGYPVVRFSRSGYLKLQLNHGNAKKLFRIKEDTKIIIELQ
ncbi:MAG: SAM-dependent chlorinase/fluorinase [Bacteroidia bacterium]|nr:SAM-dependent chlorinase/fluorinase [Bacteroidia bacterium]